MNEPLSIYIHIPFCVRKCLYCDFVSFPPQVCSGDIKDEYIDALIKELSFYSEIAGRRIETAFVGGGTPSSLSAGQLKRFLDGVNRHFDIGGEYSIEVNPATVDTEKLDIMRDFGINRISIGLQSIFDRELKLLGRAHDYCDFLKTLELVKKSGFENINVDLMSALPGSDIKTWTKTLETVADMDIQHISAYSLIIEEGTPFGEIYGDGNTHPELPDEDTEREMYHITKDILSSRGFHQYEISNYAKSGFECRHNVKYWRGGYYIGAGLSASGHLPVDTYKGYAQKYMFSVGAGSEGDKNHSRFREFMTDHQDDLHSVRYRNTTDISKYLTWIGKLSQKPFEDHGPGIPDEHGEEYCPEIFEDVDPVSDTDFVRELFIFGLRMNEGVEVGKALDSIRDKDFVLKIRADIDRLKSENLIEENNGIIRLTDKGRDFENYVVSFFV